MPESDQRQPLSRLAALDGRLSSTDERRDRLASAHPGWDRAHLLAALLFGFGLGLPITPLELVGIPLMAVGLLRLAQARSVYADLIRHPVALAGLAWVVWSLVAIAWSPDRSHALDELSSLRWLWVPVALWPVLNRRVAILLAIGAGMLLLHASQVTQALANQFGWASLDFDRYPDRISGWTAPVVAGSILCAVLGMHAGPAALARGGSAWLARGMVCVTGVALLATGTRGAWIAGAGVLSAAACAAVLTRWRSIGGRGVAIAGAIAVVIAAGAWFTVGEGIVSRVDEARAELRGALEGGDYSTSTGGRLIMWSWAAEAVRAHPVAGVGTGGYLAWVGEQQDERGIDPDSQRVLAHAHGSFIHIAATQGLIGLALFAAFCVLAMRSAWGVRTPEGSYATGIAFGILGMLLAGVFDCVHINAQSSAVFAALVALGMRPSRATDLQVGGTRKEMKKKH